MNYLILIVFLFIPGLYSAPGNNHKSLSGYGEEKVPLGDPFILLWEGKYYAYGTWSGDGIAVFVSDDLHNWKIPEGIQDGLALNKRDVWGDHWFWAPEVYYVNGRRICHKAQGSLLYDLFRKQL